jgi:hypothetical protein
MEYPYQLVAFLNQEPKAGEPIYDGPNGWYPQIALKRRFGLQSITEEQLLEELTRFAANTAVFDVRIGQVGRPERMPVEVIEIQPDQPLMDFHTGFIRLMGEQIVSRYPDREGANYFPHVTLEYWQRRLFDPAPFINTAHQLKRFWLVKDPAGSEATQAFRSFELGK